MEAAYNADTPNVLLGAQKNEAFAKSADDKSGMGQIKTLRLQKEAQMQGDKWRVGCVGSPKCSNILKRALAATYQWPCSSYQ